MTGGPAATMTGAEYLIRALAAEGTTTLFMVPGGHNDPFMTPMTHVGGVETVVAAHEGGAAYMADGWARATGRTGAAFGIGGPGIFNMITALSSSRSDRVPVLAVSGEVPVTWEGSGGFQDATSPGLDDVAVTRPICDISARVESPQVLDRQLRTLLLHASNRLTPVHLSIPLDVQRASIRGRWTALPSADALTDTHDRNATDRLLGLLETPATIAILAGPGVIHGEATDALIRCAETWCIPVANTLGAKGVMPEDHPLSMGTFGYAGSRWATDLLLSDAVDVLLVVGSVLSQRDTLQWDRQILPNRALVHVETDPTLIGRLWPAEVPVVSAPGPTFTALSAADGAAARGLDAGRNLRQALVDRIKLSGTRDYDEETRTARQVPLHPAAVVAAARRSLPRETVAVVDSGAHRAFAAQHWQAFGPRDYLSATNIGPMGAAIPIAVGAAEARPRQQHVVFTGDGCMLMHGMELHTAVRRRSRIVLVVINNRSYGNIWYRAHQMGDAEARLTDIDGIDWLEFGRSLGATGTRVESPDELPAALARATDADGPFVIDARADKTAAKPTAPWTAAVREWEDNH